MAMGLELFLNLGDAHHQAALISVVPVTSTPSLNLIPSMTFGNWFLNADADRQDTLSCL
jgi:hypothetical protein